MSETRAIRVESCDKCCLRNCADRREDAFAEYPYFFAGTLSPTCPLPKWPSVSEEWLATWSKNMFGKFLMGGTAADPLEGEIPIFPLAVKMLKSIGVEVSNERN